MAPVALLVCCVSLLACALATTISKCGNGSTVLTTRNGILTDGGGALGYHSTVKCAWLISPEESDHKVLKINITMLSIDWSDSFSVYDGLSVFQKSPLYSIHRLTGPYQVLYTTGPLATITYQGYTASPGFALEWSVASSCSMQEKQVLTDASGLIAVDPNGPLCSFLVKPDVPDLSDIVVMFNSYCHGEIAIYDGDDLSSNIIYSSSLTNSTPGRSQVLVGTSKSLLIVTGQPTVNVTSSICLELVYYSRACNQTFPSVQDHDEGYFGIGYGYFSDALARLSRVYNASDLECAWTIPSVRPISLKFLICDFTSTSSLQIFRSDSNSLLASFDAQSGPPPNFVAETGVVVKYSCEANLDNNGLLVNYAPVLCYYPTELTLSSNNPVSFGFGDADIPSEPGLFCIWNFQPTMNVSRFVRLSFFVSQFNSGDSIIVYSNQINSVITTVKGDLQFTEIDVEMQPLTIQYISSATNPGAGWTGEISSVECPTLGLLVGMSGTVTFDTSLRESGCSYNISPHSPNSNATIAWIEITFTQIENDLAPVYVRTTEVVYDDAIIRQNTPIMLRSSQAIITLPHSVTLGTGSFSYRSGTEPLSCTNEIRSARAGSILIGDSPLGDGTPTLHANCSWLILPPHLNHSWHLKIIMSLVQDTLVTLYFNGTSNTDPSITTITNVTAPTTFEKNVQALFVKWYNPISGNCSWSLSYLWVPMATADSWTLLGDASGTITHAGSPHSELLYWAIVPPGTNWLELSVNSIHTEDSFDYITIFSGINETALMSPDNQISFTGQVALQPLFVPKMAIIKWQADASIPSQGWEISWATQPLRVGPLFNSAKKEVCSLDGPFWLNSSQGILTVNETTYVNDNFCQWVFSLPVQSNSSWIKFTISNLSVEDCCDRLTIYQNGTVLKRWSGIVAKEELFARPVDENFKFSIEWYTNGQTTGLGWTLTWETGKTSISANLIKQPAPLPLYDGCQSVRSLESFTSTGFAFVLFAPEAIIASSSTNGSFSPGYCKWIIKAPGTSIYHVKLRTWNIGDDTIFLSGSEDEIVRQATGANFVESFSIPGDMLVVSWTGNGKNTGTGWELRYSQSVSASDISPQTLDPGIITGIAVACFVVTAFAVLIGYKLLSPVKESITTSSTSESSNGKTTGPSSDGGSEENSDEDEDNTSWSSEGEVTYSGPQQVYLDDDNTNEGTNS